MCTSDARFKDVKRLRGQKPGQHNVRAVMGCLVTTAVKPTKWWGVTAGKRASNMSTDAVKTECFCAAMLYCSFAQVLRSHVLKRAKDVVSLSGSLWSLSSSFSWWLMLFFFLSFNWLRIWAPDIPALWIGLPLTCRPPCPWLKCPNHCWVEAGAHLRDKRRR